MGVPYALQQDYRLFAFWDKDEETLVIATHGIIKKTQKTSPKEIAKALPVICVT